MTGLTNKQILANSEVNGERAGIEFRKKVIDTLSAAISGDLSVPLPSEKQLGDRLKVEFVGHTCEITERKEDPIDWDGMGLAERYTVVTRDYREVVCSRYNMQLWFSNGDGPSFMGKAHFSDFYAALSRAHNINLFHRMKKETPPRDQMEQHIVSIEVHTGLSREELEQQPHSNDCKLQSLKAINDMIAKDWSILAKEGVFEGLMAALDELGFTEEDINNGVPSLRIPTPRLQNAFMWDVFRSYGTTSIGMPCVLLDNLTRCETFKALVRMGVRTQEDLDQYAQDVGDISRRMSLTLFHQYQKDREVLDLHKPFVKQPIDDVLQVERTKAAGVCFDFAYCGPESTHCGDHLSLYRHKLAR